MFHPQLAEPEHKRLILVNNRNILGTDIVKKQQQQNNNNPGLCRKLKLPSK